MKNCIKKIVIGILLISNLSLFAQLPFLENREVVTIENWKFSKGVNNEGQLARLNDANWQAVKIPHTYSMDAINDLGYYKGQAWYRTNLKVPSSMKGKRIFIRFEAVGQEAIVYLNGNKIAQHVGGYGAFCIEITDEVAFDKENLVSVNVTNAPNFKRIPVDDALFNHYGGIYRPVKLFSTEKCAISPMYFASSGVFVETTNITKEKAELEIRTHIDNISEHKDFKLKYVIKDANNNFVLKTEKLFKNVEKDTIAINKVVIENPILWNGRLNPHQYTLEVELECNSITDKVTQKFGIKSYKIDIAKGFILNDKPYRLNGVSKHQEWKETGPAVNDEKLTTDMELIDEIGATALRLSHYQHSDKTYQVADEKGLLVWAEIPYVHDYSGREDGNAKQQLQELILQNYNHPSIFVWGLWNEVRAWKGEKTPAVILTRALNKLAHKLDKSRLTISASDRGMVSNMGGITDLQAWNKYFGWYSPSVNDLAVWLDESHKEYPNMNISISEYGAGGNIEHQNINKATRGKGAYFPEMQQSKYHEESWKILKERSFVWSSFVWNMFDFSVASWNRGGTKNLNHKGLITFDRKTKKDAFYFYKANWSNNPVLYITERRHNERTEAKTTVKIYTNLKEVTLFVNNKKVEKQKLVSDINIITFKNITLQEGENTIKVISEDNAVKLEDRVIWNLKK